MDRYQPVVIGPGPQTSHIDNLHYGDVRDILVKLPRFANDNPDSVLDDNGYNKRFEDIVGVRTEEARSVFEIGCQFGHGLVTLLEACPNAEWAGWVDNESAFEGSNEAVHENLDAYVEISGRAFERWHSTHLRDAMTLGHVDVVMVDGSHTNHAALMDMAAALAMTPSMIIVDDFVACHEVTIAVAQFANHYELSEFDVSNAGAGLAIFRLERRA